MKKLLQRMRHHLIDLLERKEKVPEKGFEIVTWKGDSGQIYVEIKSKLKLEKDQLKEFYKALSELTGWEYTRDVMISMGTWGKKNQSTMRYEDATTSR